ncbi:globin domain-containing protein (plasmid) [Micromonospora zamorensis]|uniref:globin domain-containing protein n=1 Tax=Micromonospora zamorensis TaxID=709883 RepID=UPI002E1E363D
MDATALRRSWMEVESLGDEAAKTFYSLLFAADPRLRLMFPGGMTVQRDKLLKALGHIVSRVDDATELGAFAAQLGRDHRRFGVLAHHYRTVGTVLLETLRLCLGSRWTGQLALDWSAAYDVVAKIMIDAAHQDAQLNPPSWLATVENVERRTADIVVFTARTRQPYPYQAGQSCALHHPALPAVWRYLSPANAPRPDNLIEFHVRAIAGGQLSPLLTYLLQPGDVLTIGAPVGTALTQWRREPKDLLLISGGTGLAPMRAIVDQLTQEPAWGHSITLVVGADTPDDLYDMAALRRLYNRSPRLQVLTAVSGDSRTTGNSSSAVDVALASGPWRHRDVYLCGSESMVSASLAALHAAGMNPQHVHTETFTSYTYPPLVNIHPMQKVMP